MIAKHARCAFQGSYVALPTPFKDDEVDYASLQRLIDHHCANGTDGLVIVGTTGESATLSETERCGVIVLRPAFDIAPGRALILRVGNLQRIFFGLCHGNAGEAEHDQRGPPNSSSSVPKAPPA